MSTFKTLTEFFELSMEQDKRIAKLEAERDALLEAITYEGAEVVNRVTAKVIAARAAGKGPKTP